MVLNTENSNNQEFVGFIWSIADKLRGPYRPPQYRRVMNVASDCVTSY
ncbi:hypothetical protein [Nostoc sp. NZL]|nr:hypothetical protein [Nostoc sp. NZL]